MAASVDILHTVPNGLEVASAVLVGMPDAVRADALEDAAIFAPVQWHPHEEVVGRAVVDCTASALAQFRRVNDEREISWQFGVVTGLRVLFENHSQWPLRSMMDLRRPRVPFLAPVKVMHSIS